MTDATIALIKNFREQSVSLLNGLSVDQINKVPKEFNNNLIWNLGHMAYIQQLYLYGHAGLDTDVDNDLMRFFRKGSRPEKRFEEKDIEMIKSFALSSVDMLGENSKPEGALRKAYIEPLKVTAKEIELPTLDDALSFILYHDGLHVGAMKTLKRFVV